MSPKLTFRQQQILQLLWDGCGSQQIANRLRISRKTVDAHRISLKRRLRATNTAELSKAALKEGFLISD